MDLDTHPPLLVEAVSDPWRFAALRAEWDALAGRSEAPPFLRWGWLFPWWSRLGQGSEPLVVTTRDGTGALRGLLPLRSRRHRVGLMVWRFLGDRFVGSDGLQPLLECGWERAAGGALASWVARSIGQWDLLLLHGLPAGLPWAATLAERLAGCGATLRRRPADNCPVLFVEGGALGLLRRENYERRLRWLGRQSSWRVTCSSEPSEVPDALGHFLGLHARRWRERWSDAIAGPAVEGFHRESGEALAGDGMWRLYLMWLSGRPVAGVLALVDRRRSAFYYYLPVFDPAFRHRSVGMVLLGLLVESAAAAGLRRFELLRGEEPYKLELTGARWRTCSMTVAAPRVVPRLIAMGCAGAAGLRSLTSSVAPSGITDLWRRGLSRLSLKSSGWG